MNGLSFSRSTERGQVQFQEQTTLNIGLPLLVRLLFSENVGAYTHAALTYFNEFVSHVERPQASLGDPRWSAFHTFNDHFGNLCTGPRRFLLTMKSDPLPASCGSAACTRPLVPATARRWREHLTFLEATGSVR